MGTEQIYNPMEGINRMLTDIEDFIEPLLFKYHPVLHLMSKVNIYIVSFIFVALLFYILVVRKHRLVKRLKEPETYIMVIGGLIVFYLLNLNPIRLGPSFSLNFGFVVIPVISKFLGPVVAVIFGLCQYALQFLRYHGQEFSLAQLFIGGISGIVYALFIYDRRTKYLRCLLAKLSVNILCNIVLAPLAISETMTPELAEFISDRIMENVFLAPIQALLIYFALRFSRKIRKHFAKR